MINTDKLRELEELGGELTEEQKTIIAELLYAQSLQLAHVMGADANSRTKSLK